MLWAWASCIAAIVAFQFAVGGKRRRVDVTRIARRQDLHLQRKAQHALTGAMIYAASGFFSVQASATILFGCALAFYGVHGLRKRSKRVNEVYLSCFHGLLRREEINHSVLPGAFYFLLGCGTVLALFPTDLARLSMLHLSVGDPAAALIGSLYGRTKVSRGKTLEGLLACLLTSAAASLLVFSFPFTFESDGVLFRKAGFAGVCAAVAESIDLGWDDNLTLPILSASLMTAGRSLVLIL